MSTRSILEEILRAIVRRRWVVLVPFALGVAAVPFLARFAPERYRSETLIMVVPQRVPENYVRPTVTDSVADRLGSISEQILSRTRLERIILEMDLYQEERQRQVMEDVVAKMRTDALLTLVGSAANADSFRISYVSHDPDVARAVTERLGTLAIEQNLADRNNQAENTSQFLGTQLDDAKRRLIEHEKKLEEYRKRYAGQLPSQMSSNLQAIQNASVLLQSLNESTNRARDRRLLIERQMADVQAVPVVVSSSMTASVGSPATTAQLLDAARARLKVYLDRYTPDHPEVVSLERIIAELSAQLGEEMPLGATPPASEPPPPSSAELAQKRKLLELQAELELIDRQLASADVGQQRLTRVIAEYQSKVDAAPTRESELVELTRDYSTLQTAYTNLLMKREDSLIAANLERRQISEQFRILDPASRPAKPFNQLQRLQIMASGAGVGLVLGLLIVVLREFTDSSFRGGDEVERALSLPVFALIPVLMSENEQRAARRRARIKDVAGSALVAASVAVVVVWQLQL